MSWTILSGIQDFSGLWAGLLVLAIATILSVIGFILRKIYFPENKHWIKWKLKEVKTVNNTEILFIDDLQFPVISSLKNLGYKIKRVSDLVSLDETELLNSDIVFVDIQGVWRKLRLNDQGFWLVKLIRDKYKYTKKIVIYSWEELRVHASYRLADEILDKEANVLEFKATIDKLINDINNA